MSEVRTTPEGPAEAHSRSQETGRERGQGKWGWGGERIGEHQAERMIKKLKGYLAFPFVSLGQIEFYV